jgi:pilus assembly protein Flp/PilA
VLIVRRRHVAGGRVQRFRLKEFIRDRGGATAVEYGLIAAIVCAALIAGFLPMSNALKATFDMVSTTLEEAGD